MCYNYDAQDERVQKPGESRDECLDLSIRNLCIFEFHSTSSLRDYRGVIHSFSACGELLLGVM